MAEPVYKYNSLEQARNAGIAWLEARGATFGPFRKMCMGKFGDMVDHEMGVTSTTDPFWRFRLDFDPFKGPHYNAEFGKGADRVKAAFAFPGDEKLFRRLTRNLLPR
ncbi:MAG: hypothetical protein ACRC1K_09685 [Planctomycetia bacterium]